MEIREGVEQNESPSTNLHQLAKKAKCSKCSYCRMKKISSNTAYQCSKSKKWLHPKCFSKHPNHLA